VPKGKKIKVLTHQPRYIETAMVPKLGEGTPSIAEPGQSAPAGRSVEKSVEVPKVPATGSAEAPKHTVEAKGKAAEEPDQEKTAGPQKILSLPPEPELPKVSKAPAITPKRRMESVLDAVMESTRALTPTPAKKVAEAVTARVEAEAEPSIPIEAVHAGTEQESSDAGLALEKKDASEKVKSSLLEAPSEDLDFIIRHASGKRLSEEEIAEAKHYARELKYPKGALVYDGIDEDDFLYCLPDNKEIYVCREMAKNMGFPKLEVGLSAMSMDDLADSLAYNSLKVRKLWTYK
jgi:hypothetical protein